MNSKDTLRQEALKHREMTDFTQEDPADAVDYFWEKIKPEKGQAIAAYYPKGREFDPMYILERALERGVQCCLPVIQKENRVLKFAKWDKETELKPGPFDIMQPVSEDFVQPDIVVVPLLVFDTKGRRLGYGGGYYDATLRDLRAARDIVAVGAAYSSQACLFSLPEDDTDERLDMVVTPQGIKVF